MTTVLTTEWLQARIDSTKAQITSLEDAIVALTDGTIQSYTLDDGQSRTVVSRHEIGRLQTVLDRLYARLEAWDKRLNGRGGTVSVTPAW